MALVAVRAASQSDVDTEIRPMELDLLEFFQAVQAEALTALKDGVKAGKSPDEIIAEIGRILDRPLEE